MPATPSVHTIQLDLFNPLLYVEDYKTGDALHVIFSITPLRPLSQVQILMASHQVNPYYSKLKNYSFFAPNIKAFCAKTNNP
jgi:hypothetical protein